MEQQRGAGPEKPERFKLDGAECTDRGRVKGKKVAMQGEMEKVKGEDDPDGKRSKSPASKSSRQGNPFPLRNIALSVQVFIIKRLLPCGRLCVLSFAGALLLGQRSPLSPRAPAFSGVEGRRKRPERWHSRYCYAQYIGPLSYARLSTHASLCVGVRRRLHSTAGAGQIEEVAQRRSPRAHLRRE